MRSRFGPATLTVMAVALAIGLSLFGPGTARAYTALGTGTGNLIGGDLTDPENDGTAGGANYNWTYINSTDEPGFGDRP